MSDSDELTIAAAEIDAVVAVFPIEVTRPTESTRVPHEQPMAGQNASPHVQDIAFDRHELRVLMNLYGRKVAAGEWRDYAMDFLKDRAVFSIFRRSAEYPIYRIEKNPKLARKQGAYAVLSATGQILKRGHELDRVLRVLDKPLKLVVG